LRLGARRHSKDPTESRGNTPGPGIPRPALHWPMRTVQPGASISRPVPSIAESAVQLHQHRGGPKTTSPTRGWAPRSGSPHMMAIAADANAVNQAAAATATMNRRFRIARLLFLPPRVVGNRKPCVLCAPSSTQSRRPDRGSRAGVQSWSLRSPLRFLPASGWIDARYFSRVLEGDLWTYPKCGRRFVGRDVWHACGNYSVERFLGGQGDRVPRAVRSLPPPQITSSAEVPLMVSPLDEPLIVQSPFSVHRPCRQRKQPNDHERGSDDEQQRQTQRSKQLNTAECSSLTAPRPSTIVRSLSPR
jgi:hypothetical protein